jgi:hypothetical protein
MYAKSAGYDTTPSAQSFHFPYYKIHYNRWPLASLLSFSSQLNLTPLVQASSSQP